MSLGRRREVLPVIRLMLIPGHVDFELPVYCLCPWSLLAISYLPLESEVLWFDDGLVSATADGSVLW